MHGQRLFHSLAQTPGRTRIEVHQFTMERLQRLFGAGIIFYCIGRIQLLCHSGFLFIGQIVPVQLKDEGTIQENRSLAEEKYLERDT